MYICIAFSRREGESNALRNELRCVRLENNGEFLQRQKSIFALLLKETRGSSRRKRLVKPLHTKQMIARIKLS